MKLAVRLLGIGPVTGRRRLTRLRDEIRASGAGRPARRNRSRSEQDNETSHAPIRRRSAATRRLDE